MSLLRRAPTALLLALLGLAACGGDDDDDDPDAGISMDAAAEGCEACDPATRYCHEHIIDGPSDFTCEPFPEACGAEPDCDCLEAESCPKTLQACGVGDGGLLVLECVEG
jgi:hypothetical protein